MKVVLISTYPPQRCGVGEYAAHLAEGYRAAGAQTLVYAEQSFSDGVAWSNEQVKRRWERRLYQPKELAEEILSQKPDLVDIQHEFGIWPDTPRFVEFVRALNPTRVCITLHTVPTKGHPSLHTLEAKFIVHTTAGLVAWPGATMLPHPTPEALVGPQDRDPSLLVSVGFASPSKDLETVLEAVALSHGQRYIIAGSANADYASHLSNRVWQLGLNDRVELRFGYHEHVERHRLLACAGLAILNTKRSGFPSASGVARECLALNTPTASACAAIYDDLHPGVGVKFPCDDPQALATILASRFWTRKTWHAHAFGHFSVAQAWTFEEAAKTRLELACG